ncbi:hypothetical protein LTR37_019811 [Vermiconidia calcicola]|uniref:Uncharacterized protein n=1 Tax=Vermiconidia calcicola TaxID=1690605 RepID=A0ACC3MD20_9PEZI|nr:hypothetical protein LTR37_019811 [Vermiconidia calcicola]
MESDKKKPGRFATFDGIYGYLTSNYGFPVLASASPYPHDKALSHSIADLSIHPTLEAILHILNADLSSAHFLCRHMQNKPALEGMYIHGLLHRVEGDYENAKAWYGDVADSECFKAVWSDGGLEGARDFIDGIKELRDMEGGRELRERLSKTSEGEIDALVAWCKQQFGTEKVQDARQQAWVEPSEEHRAMAAKMVVGGEGWRKF